jgi:hypothetical protein
MIIVTGNTHDELDEKLHDTRFLVCSVGSLAYLQVECKFNRHTVDDVLDELEDREVTALGIHDDMSEDDLKDLMFLFGRQLRNQLDKNEYEQHCLDLRHA